MISNQQTVRQKVDMKLLSTEWKQAFALASRMNTTGIPGPHASHDARRPNRSMLFECLAVLKPEAINTHARGYMKAVLQLPIATDHALENKVDEFYSGLFEVARRRNFQQLRADAAYGLGGMLGADPFILAAVLQAHQIVSAQGRVESEVIASVALRADFIRLLSDAGFSWLRLREMKLADPNSIEQMPQRTARSLYGWRVGMHHHLSSVGGIDRSARRVCGK